MSCGRNRASPWAVLAPSSFAQVSAQTTSPLVITTTQPDLAHTLVDRFETASLGRVEHHPHTRALVAAAGMALP